MYKTHSVLNYQIKYQIFFSRQVQLNLNKKVLYPLCQKQGSVHSGEPANFICLEEQCKQNDNLFCLACQIQDHKDHKFIPLKYLLENAYQKLPKLDDAQLDLNQASQILDEAQNSLNTQLDQIAENISKQLQTVKENYKEFFTFFKNKIQLKNEKKENIEKMIKEVYEKNLLVKNLSQNLKVIMDLLPVYGSGDIQDVSMRITDSDIKREVEQIQNNLSEQAKQIEKSFQPIITQHIDVIQSLFNKPNYLKPKYSGFEFQSLMHPSLIKANNRTVKSTGQISYKFAVLEPCLNKTTVQKFGFHIKTNTSWISVGICQPSIVKQKGFTFQFSNIGHGGYLAGSNGSIWNTNQSNQNNLIKSFKYNQNDVVICEFDPLKNQIYFYKEATKEKDFYKLDIKPIDQEIYHPCVLFYYSNDEVEFVNNV